MRLRVGSPSHSLSPSLRSKVSFIVILVILLSGLDGVIAPAQAVASTPCPLGGIQSLTDLNCHLDSTAVQTSPATFTCPSGYLPSGTNVVVSGVTPNCTSTYPATSIPSCPNTGGTLSTDGLCCMASFWAAWVSADRASRQRNARLMRRPPCCGWPAWRSTMHSPNGRPSGAPRCRH